MARCKDVECNKQCPKGVPWCAPHREGKILTSAQQAALDQSRKYHAEKASARVKAGKCQQGCGRDVVTGRRCRECNDKSNEYRNEFRSDRREDGVCREGPCGKPVHPNSPFCTEHRAAELVRTNARYELYKQAQLCITPGCSKPLEDDETAVRCSDCRQHRRESEAVNPEARVAAKELPLSSLSLLEAIDLKHDYLKLRLAKVNLPDASAEYCYVDSEIDTRKADVNTAENVNEFTCLDFDNDGKPIFIYFQAAGNRPSEDELAELAAVLAEKLKSRNMVLYGVSLCDLHRYADIIKKASNFRYKDVAPKTFEPQNQLFAAKFGIFSNDPADEFRSDRPIYVPYQGLSALFDWMGKKPSNGPVVYADWVNKAFYKNKPSGKSADDCIKLFALLRVLRDVKAGVRFSAKYRQNTFASFFKAPAPASSASASTSFNSQLHPLHSQLHPPLQPPPQARESVMIDSSLAVISVKK